MNGLYLLDVQALPGAYIKDVIQRSQKAIRTGAATANGRIHSIYKVAGESRIIAVIEGGLQTAVEQLNYVAGETIKVTCCPLRPFETFARGVLGLDERVCSGSKQELATEGRQLYWLQLTLDHNGIGHEEFLARWKRDAEFLLCERMLGRKECNIYKVVAEQKLHMFFSVPSGESMDNDISSSPMIKELRPNVQISCKGLSVF